MSSENTREISSLRYLKGIGPKRAEALANLGIHTLRDLFYLFPRRYEDRTALTSIANLVPGQTTSIQGEILSVKLRPIRHMPILEVLVGDDSDTVTAVWFNQPYLKNQFVQGSRVVLYGKIELFKNRLQITSPEYEVLEEDETTTIHSGRITPVYPLTEGLYTRTLRTLLKHLVDEELDHQIHETLPENFRIQHNLMDLVTAVREMHFPSSFEALESARRRMIFDEFFIFQLLLIRKIAAIKSKYTSPILLDFDTVYPIFEKALPFELTGDQKRSVREIASDLASKVPMNRLLQGDVGSGKTVVAACLLYLAARNGFQGALLVPTEILAEQHARNLKGLLEPLGVDTALLTASTPASKRERIRAELKQGKLKVLIGTHALLQDEIRFQKLALLVVDEQHKFGVHQRSQLLKQTPRPHQLVMTATPIPRTLALTLYGDLQISSLRELPRGRQPIKTYWITRKKQDVVLSHIREKIAKGEQAYIIFPLIEETEKADLLSAKKEFERLRAGAFSGINIGLVHGKIPSEERESIMRSFRQGVVKVLVATSVIEVGVDNPNATMMIIENAERFGLAQLHQMRGRIGRGSLASECFLFGEPKTDDGARRLRILTNTTDGFEIAEEDLKLRGPGDFWGTRQSGDPLFRLANPILDSVILEEARKAAQEIMNAQALETALEWQSLKHFIDQNPIHY